MKEPTEYEKDLASIRSMMERSGKFISLSGMSGILSGLYALAGATAAYYVVQYPVSLFSYRHFFIREEGQLLRLVIVAAIVLVTSVITGLLLSQHKAKKTGDKLWNATSRNLFFNLAIPLCTGGIFILIMMHTGHFEMAAPACLVFYGLALIQGSANTYDEVRYLGFSEIGLGLVSAIC